VAVLTNVTHEHLDYHGSFAAYRDAKARLFHMLMESVRKHGQAKVNIVNADDSNADFFMAIAAERKLSYGFSEKAEGRAVNVAYQPDGTFFDYYESHQKIASIESALVGAFNVSNILAAIVASRAVGAGVDQIIEGVRRIRAVSGRMERIDEGQDFTAIVDFAHTPDALEKVLQTARAMLPQDKRLIAVFGSAGLRDVEKRRLMAETSARLADMTVLTAEDPRTESLDEILEMMAAGCRSQGGIEGETFIRVPDRGQAIYEACQMAEPGDMVMACGKGHEQSMCFGTVEHPWDDRDAMRAALRGEPLRTLPTADSSSAFGQ